jgi:hypothetical protein
MVSLSIFSLLYLFIGSAYQDPVFAVSSASANKNKVKNNIENNSAASIASIDPGYAPIITNISSKGIYEVQLGWNKPLPKGGFVAHVFFMNATGHPATIRTFPNKTVKSGGTTMGVGTQCRVPGSIKRLLPASSFDMTIYGKHGKVLWNKVNQPVTGGVGLENIVFPKKYTGDIRLLIHDIKSPAWLQKIPTDSIEFSGKVG